MPEIPVGHVKVNNDREVLLRMLQRAGLDHYESGYKVYVDDEGGISFTFDESGNLKHAIGYNRSR